jgi:hypothetical protein
VLIEKSLTLFTAIPRRQEQKEDKKMTDQTTHNSETMSEDVAQNAGARAAAIDADPNISVEEARNAAAGEGPNASGGPAPSTTESYVPSTSNPNATSIPTANAPDPEAANPETNPNAARKNTPKED